MGKRNPEQFKIGVNTPSEAFVFTVPSRLPLSGQDGLMAGDLLKLLSEVGALRDLVNEFEGTVNETIKRLSTDVQEDRAFAKEALVAAEQVVVALAPMRIEALKASSPVPQLFDTPEFRRLFGGVETQLDRLGAAASALKVAIVATPSGYPPNQAHPER